MSKMASHDPESRGMLRNLNLNYKFIQRYECYIVIVTSESLKYRSYFTIRVFSVLSISVELITL